MEEKDVFYYFYDHEKRNGIPGKEGIQWGDDIHRTNSNRHTYYATESRAIKTTLENYRKNKTISA